VDTHERRTAAPSCACDCNPIGHELRPWRSVASLSLLWSQVYRKGEGMDPGAVADENKAFWLARGWVEP
jgi:hypothetical protein